VPVHRHFLPQFIHGIWRHAFRIRFQVEPFQSPTWL
jgi:hypothetical protein